MAAGALSNLSRLSGGVKNAAVIRSGQPPAAHVCSIKATPHAEIQIDVSDPGMLHIGGFSSLFAFPQLCARHRLCASSILSTFTDTHSMASTIRDHVGLRTLRNVHSLV